ncbi:hypothetical protein HYFRA_00007266 [Hymenoscyphus fraxineus]|uniref:2EXR domain-containing protein n=1 Tax=Hymenoscyphus fraxineus TaxID=746836 RepID=A0A9N9KNY4_9HELO|nr:hypothetical protein HYFRA_00007266 [Hymenoscyphus fraxineus]
MNNSPDNTRATPYPSPTRRSGAQKRKAGEAGILGTQRHSKSDDNTKRQKTSTTSTATPLQPSSMQPTAALQASSTQRNRTTKSLAHSKRQTPISNALKNKSRAPSTSNPQTQSSVAMSQRKSRTTDITAPPAGLVPTNSFLPTAAVIEPPKQVAKKPDPDRPRFTVSSKPSPAILRMRKRREQAAATIPSTYYAIHTPRTRNTTALSGNRGASNSRSFPVAMSAKTPNSLSEASAHTKTTMHNDTEKPQRHPQPAKRKTRERMVADDLEEGPSKRRKTSAHTATTPQADNEHANPAPISKSDLRPNHKSRSQSKRKLDTIENEDDRGSTKRPRIVSPSPTSGVPLPEDTSMDVPVASTPTEESTTDPTTPTEFHRFMDLPAELRIRIWEIAAAVPRNVLPYRPKDDEYRNLFPANPPPVLLFTSYEAREVVAKNYKILRTHYSGPPELKVPIYFNYNIDTLYFNSLRSDLSMGSRSSKKIRNVAIHIPSDIALEDTSQNMSDLRFFYGLKNLTLVREDFHEGINKAHDNNRFSGMMTHGEAADYTLLPPLYHTASLPDDSEARSEMIQFRRDHQVIGGAKWSEGIISRVLGQLRPFCDSPWFPDPYRPLKKDVNITVKVFGSKRVRESLLQAARDDKSGVFAGIVDEDDNDLFGNSVSN